MWLQCCVQRVCKCHVLVSLGTTAQVGIHGIVYSTDPLLTFVDAKVVKPHAALDDVCGVREADLKPPPQYSPSARSHINGI